MAMQWTEEQRQVIESSGENLLVSAAAGSGKTAVLVEHVIRKVTDPQDPVGIQDMLIMTFTRAAAAEMKERIRARMEDLLEEDPENSWLRRQISLIDQAHICTIDSFCSWLVKNYFHVLDIDPDFRIPDEAEAKLLREDTMIRVMEEGYLSGDEEFRMIMDIFATHRGDENIRELVLKLYARAQSMLWPEQWLQELAENTDVHETMSGYPWAADLEQNIRDRLKQWCGVIRTAVGLCSKAPWLAKLETMFREELARFEAPLAAVDLDDLLVRVADLSSVRKVSLTKKQIEDNVLYEQLRELKDLTKKAAGELAERYGCRDTSLMAAEIGRTLSVQRGIARLAIRFDERYRKVKKDKNLAEFNDVAHWALQILWERKDGEDRPTELARELGRNIREIIVDEYQDSNMIQEMLSQALSGEYRGMPNMFMVGDVKQSIYRFRMARPDLFMLKYITFAYDRGGIRGRKIDLGRNFRSRGGTLEAVNLIFRQIMSRDNGGIVYDDHAKLIPGAGQYEGPDPKPEMIVIDNRTGDGETPLLEARAIAARIREMMDPEDPLMIYDKKLDGTRPVRYSDMVILIRSLEGWSEEMQQLLGQAGIPAYAEQKKGYFAAPEVKTLMSFLRVLDNPRQDIPLAAVMRSPLGGFCDSDLAQIGTVKPDDPHTDLWDRCCMAAEQGICTDRWEELQRFLGVWRRRAVTMQIDELLERVLDETGYGLQLAASVDGAVVMANVEMLMEKARAYENTSYHGIMNFLRYMDKLQNYRMDFGESPVVSEEEDLVRITTIHKSKGLEYPVVFVAGCGRQFNVMDTRESFLIHEKYGLLCDSLDGEKRTRIKLPHRKFLAEMIERENTYEEMRILYVALTRAKEKLICVGTEGKKTALDKRLRIGALWRSLRRFDPKIEEQIPAVLLEDCSRYLDWMAAAAIDHPEGSWEFHHLSPEDLVLLETVTQAGNLMQKQMWRKEGFTSSVSKELQEHMDAVRAWQYPGQSLTTAKAVYSVSELKHEAAEAYLKTQEGIALTRQKSSDYEAGNNLGAKRGTAYHLVMEKLPAAIGHDPGLVKAGMDRLVEAGILAEEMKEVISVDKLCRFYRSDLGRRMAEAETAGRLYKEQPFVMGVDPADPSAAMAEGREYILVQGIIDAFLVEEDGIVLWDYKTDRIPVNADAGDYLTGMYREQLYQYRNALERSWGMPVKEIWIYSFAADRLIAV